MSDLIIPISDATKAELKEAATEQETTMAGFVRGLLDKALQRRRDKQAAAKQDGKGK